MEITCGFVSVYDSSQYDAAADMGDLEDPTAGRYKEPEFNKVLINRTRPEPCDHVITLYEQNSDADPAVYRKDSHQCERLVELPLSSLKSSF